jgi:hypothetical protein
MKKFLLILVLVAGCQPMPPLVSDYGTWAYPNGFEINKKQLSDVQTSLRSCLLQKHLMTDFAICDAYSSMTITFEAETFWVEKLGMVESWSYGYEIRVVYRDPLSQSQLKHEMIHSILRVAGIDADPNHENKEGFWNCQ